MTKGKNYVIPILILILIVCIAGLVCSCSEGKPGQSGENEIAEVTKGNLIMSITASGHIEMPHQSRLAFEAGGTIDKVYVELGEEVKKDEILAELDTSAFEREVKRAQTNLQDARRNLSRAGPDARSIEAARNQLRLAQISLDEAREKLEEAKIFAPFGGLISDVAIKEGNQVTPGAIAFLLVDPTKVEAVIQIDEIDVAKVETGQETRITLDALPEVELRGEVVAISEAGKSKGGVITYEAKVGIENPPDNLRSGMTATAHIVTQRREDALLVPTSAIRFEGGKSIVKVVGPEGKAEAKEVEIGVQTAEQTEIKSGLHEGDKVLIQSAEKREGFGF